MFVHSVNTGKTEWCILTGGNILPCFWSQRQLSDFIHICLSSVMEATTLKIWLYVLGNVSLPEWAVNHWNRLLLPWDPFFIRSRQEKTVCLWVLFKVEMWFHHYKGSFIWCLIIQRSERTSCACLERLLSPLWWAPILRWRCGKRILVSRW